MAAKKPASRPRFGNWESIHPIGVGAFGVAIKARHVQSNKFAVLKFLQPTRKATDPEEIVRELKRFEKEKNRLAQFDSKYISKFYDADLSHNPPWIALQYFAGTTVLEEIQQNGPIDEKKWFEMGHDILSALSYIHGEGVIHRDLNPKNVMLVYGGARLIDFGISRVEGADQSSTHFYGANGYTSPEHFIADANPKNDIFVAATILAFAGTAKIPWKADTASRYDGSIFNDTPNYWKLSDSQKILLRAMHQKKPEDRASADQALKLLNSLTSQNTTTKSVPVKKLKTSQAKSNLLIEQSDENLRVSVRKPELNTRANTAQNFFTKENKGLILLAIFTGGWGLLMYWLINRYAKSGSVPKKQILRLCISSIICAASYGFFLFIPAFYWSKKLKDRELFWSAAKLLFLVFPSIIAIGANIEDEAQNPGSEVPTWVAFYLLFIFILVYRIHRRIYRTIATGQIQTSKKNKKNKSKESNKKVKSDQQPVSEEPTELGSIGEKSSPVITDSKLTTADNSWDLVETTIFDYLAGRKGKQFTIDILSNTYTGIYLQGYSEPGGYITVEAAANESVKPDLGVANRKGLIKVGWEPPSDGLPNYIKFLDLKESENTEIAKLFVETLRDGYLLEIGSFKVML